MMQTAPRTIIQRPIGPTPGDLEGAIWKSYLACIESFQAFAIETEQLGNRGMSRMTSNTFPSIERFVGNLVILEGILIGTGLADEEYLQKRDKQLGNDMFSEREEGDYDPRNVWIQINKLLKRQNLFKARVVDLGKI